MKTETLLSDLPLIAFDTETSGAYPVGFDVVEFGAVKWFQGKEVGRLQFLFKPREAMSDFIIGIHGISNEMVAGAPSIGERIQEIHEFFQGSISLAHHAPFDIGFLAYEFEKARLPLPTEPSLCTSLLSRKWINGVENHKLQTLVKHLQIDGGQAHRAYDDAKACLEVALHCFEKMGKDCTLESAILSQEKRLLWKDFSINALQKQNFLAIKEAILARKDIDMIYQGGTHKNKVRRLTPLGIVRNPDGDYLQALDQAENLSKRYYLSRIGDVTVAY